MCSLNTRKEANRLNWIVKGKLIDASWSDEEVQKTYDSYFKRLWGNNESYIHEKGFEAAWFTREEEMFEELNRQRSHVAVIGYD
tara:strand:- start:59 stop:310 length:252 start_codon:yes stop_codon:yes gene_type:complete